MKKNIEEYRQEADRIAIRAEFYIGVIVLLSIGLILFLLIGGMG